MSRPLTVLMLTSCCCNFYWTSQALEAISCHGKFKENCIFIKLTCIYLPPLDFNSWFAMWKFWFAVWMVITYFLGKMIKELDNWGPIFVPACLRNKILYNSFVYELRIWLPKTLSLFHFFKCSVWIGYIWRNYGSQTKNI